MGIPTCSGGRVCDCKLYNSVPSEVYQAYQESGVDPRNPAEYEPWFIENAPEYAREHGLLPNGIDVGIVAEVRRERDTAAMMDELKRKRQQDVVQVPVERLVERNGT